MSSTFEAFEEEDDCPYSGGKCVYFSDYRSGEMVCQACGKVSRERIIDLSPEWRNFNDSNKDYSRAEEIDPMCPELSARIAPASARTERGDFNRNMVKKTELSSRNRNLKNASDKLSTLCELLKLQKNVFEQAKLMYKQIHSSTQKSMKGFQKEAVLCAVLFLSCKKLKSRRSFREIAQGTKVDEQAIRRCYCKITKVIPTLDDIHTNASDLVNRFCEPLHLDYSIVKIAKKVADRAVEYVEGRTPPSIAAAAIFIACKHGTDNDSYRRIDKDVANAASISVTTLRTVYSELATKIDDLLRV